MYVRIESEKWDAVMLCNIYGVPPELLGLTQKTYNNVKGDAGGCGERAIVLRQLGF